MIVSHGANIKFVVMNGTAFGQLPSAILHERFYNKVAERTYNTDNIFQLFANQAFLSLEDHQKC
jgi:hypothetical protein